MRDLRQLWGLPVAGETVDRALPSVGARFLPHDSLKEGSRLLHCFSLAFERERRFGIGERDPARLLDFVIVIGDIAAQILEEKQVHEFVKTHPSLRLVVADIPVLDDIEWGDEVRLDASFLVNFAHRRLLGLLTFVDDSLRKLPAALRPHAHECHLDAAGGSAKDDAASGDLLHRRESWSGHSR
jgi:hypothetical protein